VQYTIVSNTGQELAIDSEKPLPWLTLAEASASLGRTALGRALISPRTLERAAKRGELVAYNWSNKWKVLPEDVKQFISAYTASPVQSSGSRSDRGPKMRRPASLEHRKRARDRVLAKLTGSN
jgi:hypothetical protein